MTYIESTDIGRAKLSGNLAEFRQALDDEIETIKRNGLTSTILTHGRHVESSSADFWYSFHIEYLPILPEDTPCKLLIGTDSYDVTVVSLNENAIIVSSKSKLPDIIARARLENGATVLLERLIKRIELNAEKINLAGNRMLPSMDSNTNNSFTQIFGYEDLVFKSQNKESQNQAILSAITNDITYIWGPPGTGKTDVIGQIIIELIQRERSVLLLSHTNAAVDGAIIRADEQYNKTNSIKSIDVPYPILRLGNPSKKLEDRLLIKSHINVLGRELYSEKEELEREERENQSRLGIIVPKISKANWIHENHLTEVAIMIDEINLIEKELCQLRDKRNNLNKELDTVKPSPVETKALASLWATLKSRERDFIRSEEQLNTTKADLKALPYKIQYARDELVKYKKYKDLKTEESNQLSIPYQKEQIERIESQLSELRDDERRLISEKDICKKKIEEYNQKGNFAKLLSGKNSYIQSVERVEEIQKELTETYSLFKVKALTLETYENELIRSLFIQEQLNALKFTESEENLKQEFVRMNDEFEKMNDQLPVIENQYFQFKEELFLLRNTYAKHKKEQDKFLEIEQRISELGILINQKQNKVIEINKKCFNELETDLEKYASLGFLCNYNDLHSVFIVLSDFLQQVKAETENIDISALEFEKQEIYKSITEIQKRISDIDDKMRELEKLAITQARVIGTTLVKSYLNETLQVCTFDTVILDEASMASIPALWCASYLAEKNIVIVGDFKQLPPIVMADTPIAKNWLGKDIFYMSGIQDKLNPEVNRPKNFIVLVDQFRMEEEIADIANIYYKEEGIVLNSEDYNERRIEKRREFYQWYPVKDGKHCVNLIDTKNLHAWVTGVPQGKNHSRLNCFSATLCVDLAFNLLESKLEKFTSSDLKVGTEKNDKPYILIVSPYKPHTTKIKQLIEFEYKSRNIKEYPNFIHAGTIHSFQGNEADVVIFDLVIDEPHWKANLFMQDKTVNNELKKMFNVAITRSRFKLFVVGNFSYSIKRAKNNALGYLLNYLIIDKQFPVHDAKLLFPRLKYTRNNVYTGDLGIIHNHIICKEDSFFDYFINDIIEFQSQLIIYSPFITQDRLSSLLPYFSDAIAERRRITIVTKALTERNKTEISSYKKCEEELRSLGIDIIHKKGMHEKLIFIDESVVWMGSLNALSFTGLTGEIMHRHKDESLFSEYAQLFGIEHIRKVAQNPYEQKCPICNGEIVAAESDSGGFYWTCENKDYSRQPTQPYPVDGIIRCKKCGSSYEFMMKNQPRWVCSVDSSHYQLIRESDLRLGKMLLLIPKKDRKMVMKYFTDRRNEREKEKPNKKSPVAKKGIKENERQISFLT